MFAPFFFLLIFFSFFSGRKEFRILFAPFFFSFDFFSFFSGRIEFRILFAPFFFPFDFIGVKTLANNSSPDQLDHRLFGDPFKVNGVNALNPSLRRRTTLEMITPELWREMSKLFQGHQRLFW